MKNLEKLEKTFSEIEKRLNRMAREIGIVSTWMKQARRAIKSANEN